VERKMAFCDELAEVLLQSVPARTRESYDVVDGDSSVFADVLDDGFPYRCSAGRFQRFIEMCSRVGEKAEIVGGGRQERGRGFDKDAIRVTMGVSGR
jgi:hypothetical protein